MKPIVLDPQQPANGGPLRFYQAHLSTKTPRNRSYDIDDYELHTHPELVSQFIKLSQDQLASCLGAAYGYPVLVNPINNILFAAAIGTDHMLIRLPPTEREIVLTSFSENVKLAQDDKIFADFGEHWIVLTPFNVSPKAITSWFMIAYTYTNGSSENGEQKRQQKRSKSKINHFS